MSDHLSSLRAMQDPVIDLTDLYFFPVPDVPGRLTVVLNLFPGAQPGTAFSDAVLYRIRLAPADVGSDAVVRARGEDAVAFDVTFTDIEPATGDQGGVLRYGADRAVAFRTGEKGAVRGSEVSVFAGLRRDPFFMDVRSEVRTRATRRLAFTAPGVNAVAGQNVLSIVLELDADAGLGTDRPALWAPLGSPSASEARPHVSSASADPKRRTCFCRSTETTH
ncbi:DUF4331 family protein [Streptomyces sp. NPDC002758]